MKVKIRTWNAVATWRWDLDEDDVCGICQVHFDGTCPTCKYPGDDCSLRMSPQLRILEWRNWLGKTVSGKCGHNFHMVSYEFHWLSDPMLTKVQHCIVEWIKQDSSKGQCPMCRQSKILLAWTRLSQNVDRLCRIRMDRQYNCARASTTFMTKQMLIEERENTAYEIPPSRLRSYLILYGVNGNEAESLAGAGRLLIPSTYVQNVWLLLSQYVEDHIESKWTIGT